MSSKELEALALRCEQASGPDREIDCLIYEMDDLRQTGVRLNLTPDMRGTYYGEPDGRYFDLSGEHPVELPYQAPRFSASVDAAMTIVLTGCDWMAGTAGMGNGGHAYVRTKALKGIAADADSPALALCAAALRARALSQGTPSS